MIKRPTVEFNDDVGEMTIGGIRFAYEMFAFLAGDSSVGKHVEIIEKRNYPGDLGGTITMRVLPPIVVSEDWIETTVDYVKAYGRKALIQMLREVGIGIGGGTTPEDKENDNKKR